MKNQYKILLWIALVASVCYLYKDYKKQEIKIAPSLQVKEQEQLIVKKKTQKLPTPNASNYLEVGN